MPLVPAICTQCGAQIEVDNTHEAGICKHCGTAFITEKVINKYNAPVTNNFNGATVHMHAESELERLITAADTFRSLGDNREAAKNYEEAFRKYPQDSRGWVGYIYTSETFIDFFRSFPYQIVNCYLHEHPVFKTAYKLADVETKEKLDSIVKNYRELVAGRDDSLRQRQEKERREQAALEEAKKKRLEEQEKAEKKRLEEYNATYSLEGLKKVIGNDIYCNSSIHDTYELYSGYYNVLCVQDDILYLFKISEYKPSQRIGPVFRSGRIYQIEPLQLEPPLGKNTPRCFPAKDLLSKLSGDIYNYNSALWDMDYSNKEEFFVYTNGRDNYRISYKKLSPSPMLDKINDYIAQSWEYHKKELEKQKPVKYCYIATCVYGSYDCPQVWTLRRFRDNNLENTWYGRMFIKCYYAVSPKLIKWFGNRKWFRTFWKKTLDYMVFKLNQQGIEDTKYSDKY